MLKRKVKDLICTFAIFTILLFFVAAVTQLDSFSGSFVWDRENLSLSAFGTTIHISKKLPIALDRLLGFNDLFFSQGFSDFLKDIGSELLSLISNTVKICFEFTKQAVGVR